MSHVESRARASLLRNCLGGSELVQKLIIIASLALVAIVAVRALAKRVAQTFGNAGRTLEAQVPTRALEVDKIATSITAETFFAPTDQRAIPTSPAAAAETEAQSSAPGRISQQIEAVLQSHYQNQRGHTWNVSSGNQLVGDWLIQSPKVADWDHPGGLFSGSYRDGKGESLQQYEEGLAFERCTSNSGCKVGHCETLAATSTDPSQPPESVCVGHSDFLFDEVYNTIVSARREVRIANVWAPSWRYLLAIRNALMRLNAQQSPNSPGVEVRLLFGLSGTEADSKKLLDYLTRDLPKDAKIHVSLGGYEGGGVFSWNHSKIIAVDGRVALVGGHSWHEDVNNIANPVHEVSMRVQGPAARDAERFFDELWSYAASPKKFSLSSKFAGLASKGPIFSRGHVAAIPRDFAGEESASKNGARVISVGTMGGLPFNFFVKSPSDDAIYTLIDSAEHSVRISQQTLVSGSYYSVSEMLAQHGHKKLATYSLAKMLGVPNHMSPRLLDSLGLALVRGVTVDIVLSPTDYGVKDWGSDWNTQQVRDAIVQHVHDYFESLQWKTQRAGQSVFSDRATLDAQLDRILQVRAIRPQSSADGNHAKVILVDDSAFYIGSQNLYPGGMSDRLVTQLAEFGYIVDDSKAAGQVLEGYWNPLWASSAPDVPIPASPRPANVKGAQGKR